MDNTYGRNKFPQSKNKPVTSTKRKIPFSAFQKTQLQSVKYFRKALYYSLPIISEIKGSIFCLDPCRYFSGWREIVMNRDVPA